MAVSRPFMVVPIAQDRESDPRYDEWEFTRRLAVDSLGDERIGYVHLRAVGSSNRLADRRIATAAEQGVFADGEWLIEGWGVEPDIVVDNLPFATFMGEDAQLEAGVRYLLEELERNPVVVPPAPPYPRKGRN